MSKNTVHLAIIVIYRVERVFANGGPTPVVSLDKYPCGRGVTHEKETKIVMFNSAEMLSSPLI
jgi:hypothetical protein